jgi:phenylalanine-4-hydroxylase
MSSELAKEIPGHLLPYVAEQDFEQYSPIDHSVWRFILLISQDFLRIHAHEKYLDGLEATGISTDRIPRISEMDEKLRTGLDTLEKAYLELENECKAKDKKIKDLKQKR